MEAWDIDFARTRDIVGAVRDRCARLGDLATLRAAAQPVWQQHERVMRETVESFAALAMAYAELRPLSGA